MESKQTKCHRCVGDIKKMIKYGKTKSGSQRYICRICGKTRVEKYTYQAYRAEINQNIIQLTKEGLGIRSTARILKISATTLLKRIVSIARNIAKPIISKGKRMKLMSCVRILGIRKITSGWFMHWKRIQEQL
jgi:insertion element IS1 protein InsB